LELPTGKIVRTFKSMPESVARAGAFSPDGTKLATMYATPFLQLHGEAENHPVPDGEARKRWATFKVWDLTSGQALFGLDRYVGSVVFSADGQELAFAGQNDIVLLDAKKGHQIGYHRGNFGTRLGGLLAWTKHLLVASVNTDSHGYPNGVVFFGRQGSSVILKGQSSRNVRFSPDSRRLVSPGGVSDAETGEPVCSLSLDVDKEPLVCAFTGDGRRVVGFSVENTGPHALQMCNAWIQTWDAATGQKLTSKKIFAGLDSLLVRFASLSSDGGRIMTVENDERTVRVWATASGELLHSATFPHAVVDRVLRADQSRSSKSFFCRTFSADGQRFALYCEDKVEILSEQKSVQIPCADQVVLLAFSGESKLLAGLTENQIKVWDSCTGKELHLLFTGGDTTYLALTPDGKRAATTHQDGRIKLWDIVTGQEVLTFKKVATGDRHRLVFSPEARD
jgi:WD40 repeat protein